MSFLGVIKFSSVTVKSSSCTWTLPNILSVLNKASRYCSEVFHLAHQSFQWEMCSHKIAWETFLDFRLLCTPSDIEVPISLVRITAEIRNSDGKVLEGVYNDIRQEEPFNLEHSAIFLHANKSDLLQIVKDGELVIYLEAAYEYTAVVNDKFNSSDDLICDHVQLIKDFGALYENEKMTDAIVVVEDTEIKVHSVVLAARSEVLAAMFQSNFVEGQTRRVELSDFSADTIKCLLKFLYCASVDELDVDKALDLLRAADKYDVRDLTTYCCKFLLGQINENNVIPVLVSADIFSAGELKKRAFDYLIEHKYSVSIDEHRSLLDIRPSVLYEIVNRLF